MNNYNLTPQVYEDLRTRLASLKEIREKKLKFLERAPKGKIHIACRKGRTQYYHRIDSKDRTGKYIKKRNIDFAQRLAQKYYDEKLIKLLDKEIEELEKFLEGKDYVEEIRDLFNNLSPGLKKLVDPIDMSDEEYTQKWLSMPYKKKGFPDNYPEYYTLKGERVRSKSEVIIADTLDKLRIPYKYENPISIGNDLFHPDFAVLNVRERKVKYLEHLGMMDDREYSKNAIRKLNIYELEGYYPGKNLILSWETQNMPINTRYVERIIKEYML